MLLSIKLAYTIPVWVVVYDFAVPNLDTVRELAVIDAGRAALFRLPATFMSLRDCCMSFCAWGSSRYY